MKSKGPTRASALPTEAGGSGLFICLYRYLAMQVSVAVLRKPLQAVQRYAKLFVLLHVGYFGLMIMSMEAAWAAPGIQRRLTTVVSRQIHGGSGPLGVAGSAYASRSIPLAAGVTLALNFGIGSVLSITAPSVLVPGAGVLLAAVRSATWGLVLAPAYALLSLAMLPHSFTLLIEGEGYILAAFFALLVPIYLLSRNEGPTVGARYLNVLRLNLEGNLRGSVACPMLRTSIRG